MGFFPNPPKVTITNAPKTSNKFLPNLFDLKQQSRYNAFSDLYFNGNFKIDGCNFSFDYEPQDNILVNYPRIRYNLRNPFCTPPPPPPRNDPPTSTSFYVGDVCDCNIGVTFAFFFSTYGQSYGDKPIIGGGGGVLDGWIKGKSTPNLRLENISGSSSNLGQGTDASGWFESYDTNNIIMKRSGGIVASDGESYTSYDSVFFRRIEFTYQEVLNNGGYVDPIFPRFIYEYSIDPITPRIQERINAPWQVVHIGCIGCQPNKSPIKPPPPPKKEECDCMSCCPQFDDTLLKLILKRLGDLPAKVPDNFTKQNPSMIDIESLAELMLWQVKQLDALMGAYPIEITIEDDDLVEEGNQPKKLTIPNQSEAMAELLGLAISTKRESQAILVTAIKAMVEAGMTKTVATKTLDVALANAEFLGYKMSQVKKEMPSMFTPEKLSLAQTLKETNIDIVTYENTDKTDLQDDLKILKTMAARWNAQNWRQVKGDPVESLRQTLLGNTEAISESGKDGVQQDFNDFTEQAERGFIEITGISDAENPWGRPYSQRPKIREIGTEGGRYDKDGGLIPPASK